MSRAPRATIRSNRKLFPSTAATLFSSPAPVPVFVYKNGAVPALKTLNAVDVARSTCAKIVAMYALLVGANAAAWIIALVYFASPHALLLGTALLAYTFGLRHAVDADHISAIDNVTRKLMQDGKRPVGVGFFFSLGHATIVVALSVTIAVAAAIVKTQLPALQRIGELVGTSVSATFLLVVAAINLLVFVDIFRAFARTRRGEAY